MKHYTIGFTYHDAQCGEDWHNQSCSLYEVTAEAAVRKCKDLYGLGQDGCEYRITSVVEG